MVIHPATGQMPELPFQQFNAPTLADFQITSRCTLGCPHCYASADPLGVEVALPEVERVLRELGACGVPQIALGGGEPLSHPAMIEILELCHSHNLVPNFTTSGLLLDDRFIRAIKRYCGAVALSLEGVGERYTQRRGLRFELLQERLTTLLDRGVATVLQVTLSQENFGELEQIVEFALSAPRLYGVIFLAYKQVGRGTGYHHTLSALEPARVYSELRQAFLALSRQTRVGYDCCLTPGVVGFEPTLDFAHSDQLEGCSAMRSSVGILPSLDLTPCTFTPSL